jgi:hypothetical protein
MYTHPTHGHSFTKMRSSIKLTPHKAHLSYVTKYICLLWTCKAMNTSTIFGNNNNNKSEYKVKGSLCSNLHGEANIP